MASLSLIPFPFALHSLSSSRLAVTHGHHKPKQGREVSYTNSSQFHKVSPWAMCLKVELVPKTVSFLFLLPQTRDRQTHSMNVFVPFRRHSLNTVELRRSSKLPGWVTYVIIRRQTTSNRVEKSSPSQGHGKQTLTPSNCNKLSSHCCSDYFGSTKIVSSNSFGQNKIGHEFCLPKTDSSNFTSSMKNQPTLFKTCNLYSRHRKVSIPASLVSNNIK